MFLYQSSQPSKVRKRTQGSTNSARTDEVFEHISNASIPANPKSLSRIHSLIQADLEQPAIRSEIVKEIIADPGLGLYYLSNLKSALNLEVLPEDPLMLLHSMSASQLKEFFNVSASVISKHRLSEAGPPQILRHQHTFIASKSATNLSRQLSIEEGKTFSLVQVSQSALNLLAWSYPSQFHKALFNKKKFKASLEDSISSLVGVKADNIINKLAKKIGLPTSLLLDLQMSQRPGSIDIASLPTAPSVLSLARLGDLLARANDQEHYPEAYSQWERVEKQLEERGLENPSNEIHESIKDFVAEIGGQSSLPYHMAIFQTQSPKPSEASNTIVDPNLLNPHCRKIPAKFRDIIELAYSNMQKGILSAKALHILIEQLVPAMAINSGCLYLTKGDKHTLQPTLNFGKFHRSRPALDLHSSNPISQSIFSNLPQLFDSESGEVSICGSLSDCKKQAVLLIEFETKAFRELGENPFQIFNAFATALVDAMAQRRDN